MHIVGWLLLLVLLQSLEFREVSAGNQSLSQSSRIAGKNYQKSSTVVDFKLPM